MDLKTEMDLKADGFGFEAGHCVVMATHNLQLVDDFHDKVLRCEGKRLSMDAVWILKFFLKNL